MSMSRCSSQTSSPDAIAVDTTTPHPEFGHDRSSDADVMAALRQRLPALEVSATILVLVWREPAGGALATVGGSVAQGRRPRLHKP